MYWQTLIVHVGIRHFAIQYPQPWQAFFNGLFGRTISRLDSEAKPWSMQVDDYAEVVNSGLVEALIG